MATTRTSCISFKANADDGTVHEVFAYQKISSNSDRPEDERPAGQAWFQTGIGKPVYHVGLGKYEMANGKRICLRTDDPRAQ